MIKTKQKLQTMDLHHCHKTRNINHLIRIAAVEESDGDDIGHKIHNKGQHSINSLRMSVCLGTTIFNFDIHFIKSYIKCSDRYQSWSYEFVSNISLSHQEIRFHHNQILLLSSIHHGIKERSLTFISISIQMLAPVIKIKDQPTNSQFIGHY